MAEANQHSTKLKSKKHLELHTVITTPLGRVIEFMDKLPQSNRNLAEATLQARFLPFVLDKNSATYQVIALQCIMELEAWAKIIREYAGLSLSSVSTAMLVSSASNSDSNHNELTAINSNQNSPELDDEDTVVELFKPQNQVDELHQIMFGDLFGN